MVIKLLQSRPQILQRKFRKRGKTKKKKCHSHTSLLIGKGKLTKTDTTKILQLLTVCLSKKIYHLVLHKHAVVALLYLNETINLVFYFLCGCGVHVNLTNHFFDRMSLAFKSKILGDIKKL